MTGPGGSREPAPILLASHGSRDPASSATMRALAAAVERQWHAPVRAAFLDFDEPSIPDALDRLVAGGASTGVSGGAQSVPIVVPALLTNAYHNRVDLPAVLAATPHGTRVADVLGPDPLLVAALRRRLSELDRPDHPDSRDAGHEWDAEHEWDARDHWDSGDGRDDTDGIVLIAAGTSDAQARSTVDDMAAELGRQVSVPCLVGYASASRPTAGEAVAALGAAGARRILVASYFLAPGRLYELAKASALTAGAVAVAAPLGTAEELVRLVVARAEAAQHRPTLRLPQPVA